MRTAIARRVLPVVILLAVASVCLAEEVTVHPQHPRLIFRKEDLSWIRGRCATSLIGRCWTSVTTVSIGDYTLRARESKCCAEQEVTQGTSENPKRQEWYRN